MEREQEEGSSSRRIGHEQERLTVHGSDAERGTHPVPAKSAASLGNCVFTRRMVERVKGIEPSYEAWEAAVLPLNYTRSSRGLYRQSRRWHHWAVRVPVFRFHPLPPA
jgi:hypothetical protein